MIHDSAGRCSLCDRLVLGLAGQDWCVLPWMLDEGACGDEVLPGACHVRCLHELGTAHLWADAVEAYYCARWPLWRAGRDAGVRWRLHSSPQARRFQLWRADGRLSSFPYAALGADPLVLSAELAEVGTEYAATLLAAMGTDQNGVPVPLPRVVAALGLTDRYRFATGPGGSGTVTRRLKDVGTGRRPELIDILEARYPLGLDAGCRRAAAELIHRPAGSAGVMGSPHGRER